MLTVVVFLNNASPRLSPSEQRKQWRKNNLVSRTVGTPIVIERDWLVAAKARGLRIPKPGEMWRVRILHEASKPNLLLCHPLSEVEKDERGYRTGSLVMGSFRRRYNSDGTHMYVQPVSLPRENWMLSRKNRERLMVGKLRSIVVELEPKPSEKLYPPPVDTPPVDG